MHATDTSLYWLAPPRLRRRATLRLSSSDNDSNQEAFASFHLLMVELQDLDVLTQFNTVITARLNFIPVDFTEVIRAHRRWR